MAFGSKGIFFCQKQKPLKHCFVITFFTADSTFISIIKFLSLGIITMPDTDNLRMLFASVFVTAMIVAGNLVSAADAPEPIVVKVHRKVHHRIDPRIFGQFMERPSWSDEIGPEAALIPGTNTLRPDARDLIRNMQIPIVRFPGGTDVEHTNWLDMIDNVPGRPGGRPVTIGHTGKPITNNFGYDEFLRLCEELAMAPLLVVNFRDGLLAEDGPEKAARHAAKLVAYCNADADADLPADFAAWPRIRAKNGHPAPYRVKYIQIGNETWGYSRRLKISDDRYIAALNVYIQAIHAIDASVRIIVDGKPDDRAGRVHQQLGDRISYFAVHHYQPSQMNEIRRGDQNVDIENLTAQDIWYNWVSVPRFDSEGQSVFPKRKCIQARKMGYKIALTEWNWNGWWARNWRTRSGEPIRERTPLDSLFAKGIGAAGILHAIMRQGDVVEIATQSMLIGDGWDIHAIYADRKGRTPPYMLPTGQTTMLYSKYHGRDRLEIDVSNMAYYKQPYRMGKIHPAAHVAYLDVLATRNENRLYLHTINRHFGHALSVQIDIAALDMQPATNGTLHILEGRLNNKPAAGEPHAPGRIREKKFPIAGSRFQVRLPARTVTVVEVSLFSRK
jgi:alpha-N-arabinofuranosidase